MKCCNLKEVDIVRNGAGQIMKVEENFKDCLEKKCNSWNPNRGECATCNSTGRRDGIHMVVETK